MISEIPVDQIQETEIQETELQETDIQEANPPPPPQGAPLQRLETQPPERIPKKRGRPKKEPVPQPEPEPQPKKKPAKPKPKAAAPKVKSAALAERAGRADLTNPIVEEARFSVNDLSNAQLIGELVTRQRQTQREMKTNLYRSFVM